MRSFVVDLLFHLKAVLEIIRNFEIIDHSLREELLILLSSTCKRSTILSCSLWLDCFRDVNWFYYFYASLGVTDRFNPISFFRLNIHL